MRRELLGVRFTRRSKCLLIVLCMSIGSVFHLSNIQAQSAPADVSSKKNGTTLSNFPPDSHGDSTAAWLTKELRVCSEPSLMDLGKQPGAVSFRFTRRGLTSKTKWSVIRLEIGRDGNAVLFTKRVSQDGTITLNKTKSITSARVNAFLDVLKVNGFWSLPFINEVEERQEVKDEGTWCLEGVQDGTYHIAFRLNPKPGPFTDKGSHLIRNSERLDP